MVLHVRIHHVMNIHTWFPCLFKIKVLRAMRLCDVPRYACADASPETSITWRGGCQPSGESWAHPESTGTAQRSEVGGKPLRFTV